MKAQNIFARIFKKSNTKPPTHFLKFLGRGSCFADDHAAAFFVTSQNDFVLIDCSEQTYQRLKNEFNLASYNNVYVYITHTHGDHVGGLGVLIQFAFYALQKHITVIAPSREVKKDIETLFQIEGVTPEMYTLLFAQELIPSLTTKLDFGIPEEVLAISIPTIHVPTLSGKCFGFQFKVNDKIIVYTGDTATLEPFIPYLSYGAELYVDTSAAYKSDVHMWLPDMLPTLISFTERGIKVYLMHLDDVTKAQDMIKDTKDIEIVQIV